MYGVYLYRKLKYQLEIGVIMMLGIVPSFGKRDESRELALDNFFGLNDFFGFNPLVAAGTNALSTDIRVNVEETDDSYVVEATLPGVDKEDVHVNFDNDILTIAVKQEKSNESEERNFIHREVCVMSQSRKLRFADVDGSNITAKLDSGVLKLNIPKKEKVDDSIKIEVE